MAKKKRVKRKTVEVSKKTSPKPPVRNRPDWTWIVLGVVMLAVALVRINYISVPFERDEGFYNYFGRLLLDGRIPYVDFYATMPLNNYCYAAIQAVFGSTMKGVHIGFIILNLFTIYLLFRAGASWFNKTTGLAIATAFAIFSLNPYLSGFTTQAEHLVAFFVAAALTVLFLALERDNMRLILLTGVLFCCTLLIKHIGFLFILFGGLAVVSHYVLNNSPDWRKFFLSGAVYSAGVAIPAAIFLLVILLQGAFEDFVYWIFIYPQRYVTAVAWNPTGKQFLMDNWSNISSNHQILFFLAAAGLVLTAFTKLSWHKKALVWLFTVLSFLTVVPGLRFFGHYWINFMPAAAVLTGAAVYGISELIARYAGNPVKSYAGHISTAIFLIAIVHHIVKMQADEDINAYYTDPEPNNIVRNVYGFNPFPEAKQVGDWIRRSSEKSDRIAVFGSEPQVYFYSGRRGVSRHNYLEHVVGGYKESAERQKEFIADVEEARPRYLVFFRQPVSWNMKQGADQTIFTWFDGFSREHYDLVGMTQIVNESRFDHKWGKAEVAQMAADLNAKERSLREQMNSALQRGDQQGAERLRKSLDIYYYQVLVFERKPGSTPG